MIVTKPVQYIQDIEEDCPSQLDPVNLFLSIHFQYHEATAGRSYRTLICFHADQNFAALVTGQIPLYSTPSAAHCLCCQSILQLHQHIDSSPLHDYSSHDGKA